MLIHLQQKSKVLFFNIYIYSACHLSKEGNQIYPILSIIKANIGVYCTVQYTSQTFIH